METAKIRKIGELFDLELNFMPLYSDILAIK